MAECVVELCRQPALPAPPPISLGVLRLEIPLCAIHAEVVRLEIEWLVQRSQEAYWSND